ncbi:MAG: efflux transporter outer membrane subunit [Thermodesulfobacteriota bacterium]|nr:efflux transporter outer membrane subunit [Thermodesulfobacteriota bacterium]
MSNRMKYYIFGPLILVLLTSCTMYKAHTEIDLPLDLPQAYSHDSDTASIDTTSIDTTSTDTTSMDSTSMDMNFSGGPWWESFEDESLNALIEEALGANLDLKQAWARLDQARAIADEAGSRLMPQVSLDAGTTRSRTYVPGVSGATAERTRQHQIGIGASYEIDLWGRIQAQKKASQLDMEATCLDLETMAMTISAQVARTWFSLITQSAMLSLAEEQIEASSIQLDLVEMRFSMGLAPALSVYQQRGQLSSLKGQYPLIKAQIAELTHQLNLLLGRAPGTALGMVPDKLPDLQPLPDTGIPSDLLVRRPDVQSAQTRLAAADQRVASAIADRFPRLTINASRGYGASSFADLFDRMIWSLAGGISASIYDGHYKNREVKRSRAVVSERMNAYGQTVLNAVSEVEDALSSEAYQREYLEELRDQLFISDATLDQARIEYAMGLSDYLSVLSALNAQQQAMQGLILAHSALIDDRIQLCRALGGDLSSRMTQYAGDKP